MPLPDERACTKCGETKPLTKFSKAPRGLYGHKAHCKACDAARHQAQHVPAVVDEAAKERRYTQHQTGLKICTSCGVTKERSEFSKSKDGMYGPILRSNCRLCCADQARKWFRDNKVRAKNNRHRYALAKNYGLTIERYEELLNAQGGVCAICGKDEPNEHGRTGTRFKLSVDHCHDTNRVRGLLCQKCNRALGLLGDDVDLLRKAIDYLERK